MTKRFKLEYITEDEEWALYDSTEKRYYDIDLTEYEKELNRLLRNHQNLHEKYEQLETKYKECNRERNTLKSNVSSAKMVYENLKRCFE